MLVVTSKPPSPTTTMFWVEDALLTASPTAMFTAATVPPMGEVMVACASACCATASCTAAASTAF